MTPQTLPKSNEYCSLCFSQPLKIEQSIHSLQEVCKQIVDDMSVLDELRGSRPVAWKLDTR